MWRLRRGDVPVGHGRQVSWVHARAAGAPVSGAPGNDRRGGAESPAGAPGVQVGPWVQHATPVPPVGAAGADRADAEVHMARYGPGIPGVPDDAERLAADDFCADPQAAGDRAEVAAVVPDLVDSEQGDPEPASGRPGVHLRIPTVHSGHSEHPARCRCSEAVSTGGEDVRCRIVVVDAREGDVSGGLHGKRVPTWWGPVSYTHLTLP